MLAHDCSKCNAAGSCPLESTAPWINEHQEEVEKVMADQKINIARLCASLAMDYPLVLKCAHELADTVMMAFTIGYCKGRVYPTVPEVFENA